MSNKPAPKRWTDALSPDDPLREALQAARADVPERDRLERVYGSILAAGGGLGGDGGASDGGDGDGGSPEVDLPGDVLHPEGGRPELPPIVVPPVPAPIAAAGLGAAGLASTGVGGAGVGSGGGGVLALLGTTLGKTIGVGLLGSASVATAMWIAAPAAAPVEAPHAQTAVVEPASTTSVRNEARPPVVVAAPPTTAAPIASALPAGSSSAPIAPEDPDAEIALLRDAQAAASGAPTRALALLDESERRFPRSALAQERVVIRVQALLAAGRRDEALARARAFVAANPGSAHRPRLEQLLPELLTL